jgi:outer membrane protein assembly factor BamB
MYGNGPLTTLGCSLLSLSFGALAGNWPQFRGPNGDGISTATNLPLTWSPTQNVAWKASVPGRGRSSPVLLGDRIWLTSALETGLKTFAEGPDRMQQADRVVIGVVCLERTTGKDGGPPGEQGFDTPGREPA